MSKGQLDDQQKLFYDRYLLHFNGTKAAEEAGYSKKTAAQQASRLLRNVNGQSYLAEKREKLAQKEELNQEMVLREYARIGFSDIRKYYNADGSLKPITELDDDAAAALSGVEVDEIWEPDGDGGRKQVGETKKIKRWDKVNALAQINKMMGWNAPEKIEHSGDSFLDLLMQTSAANKSENQPRKDKKPKPKAKKSVAKPRRKK